MSKEIWAKSALFGRKNWTFPIYVAVFCSPYLFDPALALVEAREGIRLTKLTRDMKGYEIGNTDLSDRSKRSIRGMIPTLALSKEDSPSAAAQGQDGASCFLIFS